MAAPPPRPPPPSVQKGQPQDVGVVKPTQQEVGVANRDQPQRRARTYSGDFTSSTELEDYTRERKRSNTFSAPSQRRSTSPSPSPSPQHPLPSRPSQPPPPRPSQPPLPRREKSASPPPNLPSVKEGGGEEGGGEGEEGEEGGGKEGREGEVKEKEGKEEEEGEGGKGKGGGQEGKRMKKSTSAGRPTRPPPPAPTNSRAKSLPRGLSPDKELPNTTRPHSKSSDNVHLIVRDHQQSSAPSASQSTVHSTSQSSVQSTGGSSDSLPNEATPTKPPRRKKKGREGIEEGAEGRRGGRGGEGEDVDSGKVREGGVKGGGVQNGLNSVDTGSNKEPGATKGQGSSENGGQVQMEGAAVENKIQSPPSHPPQGTPSPSHPPQGTSSPGTPSQPVIPPRPYRPPRPFPPPSSSSSSSSSKPHKRTYHTHHGDPRHKKPPPPEVNRSYTMNSSFEMSRDQPGGPSQQDGQSHDKSHDKSHDQDTPPAAQPNAHTENDSSHDPAVEVGGGEGDGGRRRGNAAPHSRTLFDIETQSPPSSPSSQSKGRKLMSSMRRGLTHIRHRNRHDHHDVRSRAKSETALLDRRKEDEEEEGEEEGEEERENMYPDPLPQGIVDPLVVLCVAYLNREEVLKEAGLFRIPGDLATIRKLRTDFLKGVSVNLQEVLDPHTVAGLMKINFREWKVSIIPRGKPLSDITTAVKEKNVERVREVIQGIPMNHMATIRMVTELLVKVVEYSEWNKMTSGTLATSCGPSIFPYLPPSPANSLLKFLVDHCTDIFRE